MLQVYSRVSEDLEAFIIAKGVYIRQSESKGESLFDMRGFDKLIPLLVIGAATSSNIFLFENMNFRYEAFSDQVWTSLNGEKSPQKRRNRLRAQSATREL